MTVTTFRRSQFTWRAVVLVMSTSASWGAGSLLRAEAEENRMPVLRALEAPHLEAPHTEEENIPENLCHGGVEPLAIVELIPDAVVAGSGGPSTERIEYHAEISVRRGERVGVAWTGEVIDDRGRVVLNDVVRGSGLVGAGDVAFTNEIRTELPNGFYVLQVRAAAVEAGVEFDMAVGKQHLMVNNGRWYELGSDEWRARSRARVARTLSEVRGGR